MIIKEGVIIAARRVITEGGQGTGNPDVEFPHEDYIHALPNDTGEIVHVDAAGYPTVKFSRTGTATAVDLLEIKPAGLA